MSTDNVFELIARACRPANVGELRPRPVERTYHAILVRDDVSIGELCHALRFSGIVVSTDKGSGQVVIHRSPTPHDAA